MITWNSRRVKGGILSWRHTAGAAHRRCHRRSGAPCHGQSSAAGFTLLEVLVAVAVVAIALVTFMGLHLHSLENTIRAQDLTTAVLLAQAKMATMGEFPDPGETEGKFEGPELERFQWATAVTEHT